LDEGIITASDYNLLISTALHRKPPFAFMNFFEVSQPLEFAGRNPAMPFSPKLSDQAVSGKPWEILDVLFEKKADIGTISTRRPNASNALNHRVIAEIETFVETIQNDTDIKAGLLGGFGYKVLDSGGDIRELAALTGPADFEKMAREGQLFSLKWERLSKAVGQPRMGLPWVMAAIRLCFVPLARRPKT
jgi:hypothetical protein